MSFQQYDKPDPLLQSVDFEKIAESSTGGGGLARPFGEFHASRQGDGTALWLRLPVSVSAGEILEQTPKRTKDTIEVLLWAPREHLFYRVLYSQ